MPRGIYKRVKPSYWLGKKRKPSHGIFLKGHKVSKEMREKLSEALKGRKLSKERIEKMKGRIPWNKGKTGVYSEKTLKKISKNNWMIGKGHLSHLWKGGISFEPYSVDWTKTLRRSIRERDNYVCQLCGKLQGDRAFGIHHINYDKKDSSPDNLITLCHRCHSKTNFNRKYWTKYLRTIKTI